MVYQISVFLENRAGQFAQITSILAQEGVDLRAISIAETADYGILRMIVDDAQHATGILMQQGYLLTMTPVLVVAVPDQPGGLTNVLTLLNAADVAVEYLYSFVRNSGSHALVIFRLSDNSKGVRVLQEGDITLLNQEEVRSL